MAIVWHRLSGPLALLLLCACGAPPELSELDLADLLPDALVRGETVKIDFGTPAAQPFLLDGWSHPEGADGDRFVWAVGGRSSLRFFLTTPGSRAFVVRCHPFRFPDAPVQIVSVRIGGERVASIPLEPGLAEYRWEVPAGVLREGYNRIDFEYAYDAAPADVLGTAGRRSLAVAWRELGIEGGVAAAADAAPAEEDGALVLPFGQRVDFLVRVNGPARLEVGAAVSEAPDASLRVRAEGDRSGELAVSEIAAGEEASPLELVFSGEDILRLSLLAVPGQAAASAGPLRVVRSVLRSPPAAAPSARPREEPASRVERPNILIYAVDALRADHLGIHGYPVPLSPRIEEFARDGVVFTNARANSSWTRPTVASILTGLHPWSHGVAVRLDALSEETPTLAEALQGAGYATAAVITNGNIAREFGLAQGFDRYIHLKEKTERYGVHESAARAGAEAEAWLDAQPPERPFFLYVHASDPHGPYAPDAEFRRRFAADVADPKLSDYEFLLSVNNFDVEPTDALRDDLVALYDAEIAFMDREFGRLLDRLRERGLYDDMLIVFVADHGEEFLDHGWWAHGKTLYGEQLRVPLVVKFPRGWRAGRRVSEPAQQVDIVPTLLGYLGLSTATSQPFDGIDLERLLDGEGGDREIVADLDLDGRVVDAIVAGRWKLIEYGAYPHPRNLRPGAQLFDLETDPGERHSLADQRPIVVDYLRTRLAALRRERAPRFEGAEAEVDDQTMRNLRALGYFEE